jgi:xanthine dehydrogenase accessory factor
MMLINDVGQHFGLLSGGCLEADIVRNARKVMHRGQVLLLTYDGSDEDDWSYQLGIGCGGTIHIMLQPITPENYLGLGAMHTALQHRSSGAYWQKMGTTQAYFETHSSVWLLSSSLVQRDDGEWLVSPIKPQPHLLVVGGGFDAQPVINIASELGWETTLVDPRPANARAQHFPKADTILRDLGGTLTHYIQTQSVNAVVIMSHNIELDAQALLCCQYSDVEYLALLGPTHRFRQVLEVAGISFAQLTHEVSAPAGFNIGGQLPESIALSILAECHSVLNDGNNQRPEAPVIKPVHWESSYSIV